MTTAVKPETIPWGKRTTTHEAIPFYGAPGWNALADGQKWVAEGNPEDDRHLTSLNEVLEEMVETRTTLPPFWITAYSEEIFGLDVEGRIGKKDEPVMLTMHGGGIILQNPQSLRTAYTNKTPKGDLRVQQEKITAALSGILPNGQQVEIYTWDALSKKGAASLPRVYAIAQPLKDVEGTPSGLIAVGKLPTNRVYVARAGHPTTAEQYAGILAGERIKEYGNHHTLAQADPKNDPSGRVLRADGDHGGGLGGDSGIDYGARFVGVRRVVGAVGAAPQKTGSPLEELAGKGVQVPGSNIYVIQGLISPEATAALTGRK